MGTLRTRGTASCIGQLCKADGWRVGAENTVHVFLRSETSPSACGDGRALCEGSYKERVTNDPCWVALSWSDICALGDIENRAHALTVTEGTEVKVSETNRPGWASEGYRDGQLRFTRYMIFKTLSAKLVYQYPSAITQRASRGRR